MTRSRRCRREELRSSSRSVSPERPRRRRRRATTPSPSISPPREQVDTSTPQQAGVSTSNSISDEQIRRIINEVSRVNTPAQSRGENRGGGHGRARGWGRGRWVNFGFYLPHPGPYTPFCRAHREAGCPVCMYFSPNASYVDPAQNNFTVENQWLSPTSVFIWMNTDFI